MSTTTHPAAPRRPAEIDPGLANDVACTLTELSCVPDDTALLRRAAEQLPLLTAQVRRVTRSDSEGSDEGWLDVARACGIVRERTH
ncbi:hypothetical protein ACFV2X_47985 [Streptomyces sp. NPDC059679]|uniref:hypothetical protein n=1 Tax=Streptomyces sp. NPDC059679 TaxID=3346903 RepID=UPI0036BA52C2